MSRWKEPPITKTGALFTGAAVSDLKCCGKNTLSVWTANNYDEIEEAVLVLAISRDDIQKMEIVFLEEQEVQSINVQIDIKPGQLTSIPNINNRHRNLANIDFWDLGFISEYIYKQIDTNCYKQFSKADIEKIIKQSLASGKIDESLIQGRMRKSLGLQ